MRKFLKKYTKDGKFNSLEDLCAKAIESKFLTKDLQGLDFDSSETRFFGKSLVIENKILDLGNIRIKNSIKIKFINCIIIGQLAVIDNSGEIASVYMDNCIVTETFRLFGCIVDNIEIVDCNFKDFDFYNCQINSASFSTCYIANLNFEAARVKNLHIFCNNIDFIEKYQSNIENLCAPKWGRATLTY